MPGSISQNGENDYITSISYPKEYNKYKKELLDNEQFNTLNKEFRNYIEKYFFELVYPKTLMEELLLNQIFDNDRNTPITLACKYNNQDFIKLIKDKNLVENMFEVLKRDNNLGFSGYYYLKNVKFRKAFIEESGSVYYNIPQVVLELNKNNNCFFNAAY